MKFLRVTDTWAEVPDEYSINLEITNCPHRCIGCHSPELRKDIGTQLTKEYLKQLSIEYPTATVINFMGGDVRYPKELEEFLKYVKKTLKLKTCLYTGNKTFPNKGIMKYLDYIKIGGYDKTKGPLTVKTTNQRFYKLHHWLWFTRRVDYTYKFQKY